MKDIELGDLTLRVCEHKGDISYERFVKFKQYAPQFWERMDSPLFEVYWEKYLDFHNKGQFAQAMMAMRDYKFAIDNSKNSYDAWGVCFALIVEIKDDKVDEKMKICPNDADVKDKLGVLNKAGLTAEIVKSEVVNFMQTSPETFVDHLTLFAVQSTMNETGS